MDPTLRAFYRQAAHLQYATQRRNGFLAWFNKLMLTRSPDDYVSIRISTGDSGLDGFRLSSMTVFQVFAPRASTASVMAAKIEADFRAALSAMAERDLEMKAWVFVHNDVDDMPAEATLKLAELRNANPGIKITRWGFDAIWREHEDLTLTQLQEMFGVGPTEHELRT